MVQYFPIVTGSLTVTGSVNVSGSIITNSTITATTLVVQTITSSISSITGSTNFGSLSSNTHIFTGSMAISGGLVVSTPTPELTVGTTGVTLGNALTDSHVISGSLRVNPNGLFVSGSGNVGIGTINPRAYRLQLVNSGSNAQFGISNQGTADGDRQLRIGFGGNGADTFASIQGTRLNVADDVNLILQPGGGQVLINTTSTLAGGSLGINGNLNFGGTAGGNYRITNYQAGFLAFDTDNTERFKITSTGTFQFNISGPGLLTLGASNSYGSINGGSGAAIYLNGATRGGATTAGSGVAVLAADGNMYFTDGSTNTYKMFIGSNGVVGVNTTGNICRFVVYDTGSVITSGNVTFDTQARGIELYNGISGTTDNLIGYWFSVGPHKSGIASGRTNAGAGWELDLRFFVHDSSTTNLNNCYERMRLYGGGNLTINGSLTQNGSLSDLTLKENLAKILNPLDKVSQINGYTFTWKENAPARQHISNIVNDAGLIAQEVEEILPEIVRQNEDGTKALNYNGVTGLLIEAIKELNTKFEEYKATHP